MMRPFRLERSGNDRSDNQGINHIKSERIKVQGRSGRSREYTDRFRQRRDAGPLDTAAGGKWRPGIDGSTPQEME